MGTLHYKLHERGMKVGKNAGKKVFLAHPVTLGTISFDDFCRELSDGSTVDRADVKAVLSRMATVIPRLLERGFSVDCGELGKFRASFGSKGVTKEEDFRAQLISPARVVFTPRKDFKNALRSVGFERVGSPTGETSTTSPKIEEVRTPEGVQPVGGGTNESEL